MAENQWKGVRLKEGNWWRGEEKSEILVRGLKLGKSAKRVWEIRGKKVPIFVNKEISNKKHKERKKVNKKEKE